MSSTFKIGTIESVSNEARLLIEIGPHGISYVVIDNVNECVALQSLHFMSGMSIERVADELKRLVSDEHILNENFKSTTIVYTHPQMVMVPSDLLQEQDKKQMLELVCGDIQDAYIKSDFLFRQYTYNIYPVPKQVDAVVSYLFSSPVSTHLYSLLPDMYQGTGNHLHCIFNATSFTVMMVKAGKLQAIQTFSFKAPEDVAYHLLHLCEAFDTTVDETQLHLCGMIDKESALYAELYKYFLKVEFNVLPATYSYPGDIDNYPSHYFSHLFAAASCV